MLPRPGCAEILPARSSVAEEEGSSEAALPGVGSDPVVRRRGIMGRRGARRENWRGVRSDLGVELVGGVVEGEEAGG